MVTLLKAYLIGTNDPFHLTKIFMDEIRKDLRAGEAAAIESDYGLESWNQEKKEIEDSIKTLENAIDEDKDNIEYRNEYIENLEDLRENMSGQKKARVTRYLTKYKKFVAEQNKNAKTNIARHEKYIRQDEEDLKRFSKMYKDLMGFAEGEYDAQDDKKKIAILKEAKKYLSSRIEEERKKLKPDTKADMQYEINAFNEQTSELQIVSEAEKQKQLKAIRAKYRKRQTINLMIKEKVNKLKRRYNAAILSIENLKKPGENKKSKREIDAELLELTHKHQLRAQRLAWELVGMTKPEFDEKYDEVREMWESEFAAFAGPKSPQDIVTLTEDITGYKNPFRDISKYWEGFYARNFKGELFVYNEEEKHTDGELGSYVKSPDPPLSVQESAAKLLKEKKKIWLEGGYPSWGSFSPSSKEKGKKYIEGLNDRLSRRSIENIPITNKIKAAYKDKNMSFEEFKSFIKKEYPRVLSTIKETKDSGSASAGNWSQIEDYRKDLAHVLRDKSDKDGQKLLDELDELWAGLTKEEQEHFNKPVAESGSTSHGLVTSQGRVELPKRRLKNLKSILTVLLSGVKELDLSPSLITPARYIITRIREHMQDIISRGTDDDDEETEDLTREHQQQLEFWHDLYNEALNIREELPPAHDYRGDETKKYQREQVIELLKVVEENLSGLEASNEPSEEEYFQLMIGFETLNRKMEDLEIPSWAPKKKQLEKAIDEIDAKLHKFYSKLSNQDIIRFKEMMKEMGIIDEKKGKGARLSKPRKTGAGKRKFSTERRQIIRLYTTALETIRKKLYYKYITDIEMERGISTRIRGHNMDRIKTLLGYYFPKFEITSMDPKKKSRRKPLSQKDVDTHRNRLIHNVWKKNPIKLNDYPHLYDNRVDVVGWGTVLDEKGSPTSTPHTIHAVPTQEKHEKLTEDTESETMYGKFGDELITDVQRVLNDDDDKIIDDDDMGDFAELAAEESTLSERFEEKGKKNLTMAEMQELLGEEQKEKEEEARQKEEGISEEDKKDETSDIRRPYASPKNIELDRNYEAEKEFEEKEGRPPNRQEINSMRRGRRRDMERLQEFDRQSREEEE